MSDQSPFSDSADRHAQDAPHSPVSAHLVHDLKNALNIVAGLVASFASAVPAGAAPQDFNELTRAVCEAESITRELLNEQRAHNIPRRPLEVGEALVAFRHTIEQIVGPTAALKIRAPDAPMHILAHQSELEQILINLTLNARESLSARGTVTVDVGVLYLVRGEADGAPQPHVRLTVADTGSGIPNDIVPHVFEPFFSTKPGGSGLGLSRVGSLTHTLGGWLLLESEPEAGTRVHVCFPMIDAPRV